MLTVSEDTKRSPATPSADLTELREAEYKEAKRALRANISFMDREVESTIAVLRCEHFPVTLCQMLHENRYVNRFMA
jgi:hypothetical protein